MLTHRPANAADEPFVHRLIDEMVTAELGAAAWPDAVRVPLLEIQYRGRRHGIRDRFPQAAEEILLADDEPVGWAVVARGEDEIRLVEIAVLASRRGRGLGRVRIEELSAEADAARLPLRLKVTAGNPAIRLYERLGFHETGRDDVRLWMERPVGGPRPPTAAV